MPRRKKQLFNLSFLDLLSGALGAIIFLFVIIPRGGAPATASHQVAVAFDTAYNYMYGVLDDSLLNKNIGDTLLVLLTDFNKMPTLEDCPECPECAEDKKCPPCPKRKDCPPCNDRPCPPIRPCKCPTCPVCPPATDTRFVGDPPSVPCKASFEIKWEDIKDNVDLFVCKGKPCVYGKKRYRQNDDIGQWDSGISKNGGGFFSKGTDYRTTLEAVRQIRKIVPGKYEIYAQFKESEKGNTAVQITGLVYTKNDKGKENSQKYTHTLPLDKKNSTLLATVDLKADGTFIFTKK